jgi:hypothetical protein
MNELMKGPNKRGREDFENAKFFRSVPTMVALCGSQAL